MRITKCDLCKNVLKSDKDSISAGRGWFPKFEFCGKCGKPVLDFLKKKKLIDADKIK